MTTRKEQYKRNRKERELLGTTRTKCKDYECEQEFQKEVDNSNLKSECCNSTISANSLGEYFCDNCGGQCNGN